MSNELDLDLLDIDLDDIPDAPEFTTFFAGTHKAKASLELKEVSDRAAVELSLELLETIELTNPTDKPEEIPPGSMCSTLFFTDKERSLSELKKVAANFAEFAQSTSLKTIVEQVKDVEVIVVTSRRKDKNDPDNFYLKVKSIEVV